VKALIAEDDAFFRKMLQQLLAPNYQVESVADGIRAWDALQQKDAAKLAILDWVMPGLSGPQICRNVRANPNTADCYLILLTAKNSVPDLPACVPERTTISPSPLTRRNSGLACVSRREL